LIAGVLVAGAGYLLGAGACGVTAPGVT
jgi:hypothetical protein